MGRGEMTAWPSFRYTGPFGARSRSGDDGSEPDPGAGGPASNALPLGPGPNSELFLDRIIERIELFLARTHERTLPTIRTMRSCRSRKVFTVIGSLLGKLQRVHANTASRNALQPQAAGHCPLGADRGPE
jgi:hypothetical protein